MSIHLHSQKHSLTWSEFFIVVLGMGLIAIFGRVGFQGIVSLVRTLPVTSDKAYWFISRSSGVLAYLMLTLGVMWGLVQSGGILRPTIPPLLALGLHSLFNWASLLMATLHGLILLGDSFIKARLADIIIPFIGPYRPGWVGLGVLSMYLMLLLSLSFYVRSRIGHKTFRLLHYVSYLTFLLVTFHSLGAGTDTSALWLLYLSSIAGVSLLTIWRVGSFRRTTAVGRSH
jgi:sulfoxide reductase heme-binding subunit YedZ